MTVSNGNTGLTRTPLQYSGSLSHLDYVEITPIIGREYPTAKIRDILHASNSEQQIRDLAIIICERGVVFFRAPQDDLTIDEQKRFTVLLGELTGRPEGHGLHIHPLFRDENNIPMENGQHDESIYVINAKAAQKLYKSMKQVQRTEPKDLGLEWHSDCMFEECPADFSFLRMEETPPTGGDTVWCSGYELYDRISPSMRTYFESLTATCAQPVFKTAATAGGYEVMSPRGSPLNVGDSFSPIHPMVRTHPVTGWKSIYAAIGIHVTKINDVYSYEDQMIRDYIMRLITRNHDCVARWKWTKQSCAIWSNACTLHAATPDTHLVMDSTANRTGVRASGTGEKPYLDPASKSRREALGLPLN
ncbi:Alpha-ketoglutarate-dependent taurine dioxygenase [Talaromyces islandicus]|uniref:Alpha-ketoglutarate-dependent taurine dioxygenase n=1 Tax=Talaromyces islandicus TaxID=28573 RepID=A0A0U1M0I0_TALIS|nr:Alpha-ketoglutarate-dependent taurine dioxygenase [Talaromyces islandicus]